jgi:hypothetical protein
MDTFMLLDFLFKNTIDKCLVKNLVEFWFNYWHVFIETIFVQCLIQLENMTIFYKKD